jgi:hypothetical protein
MLTSVNCLAKWEALFANLDGDAVSADFMISLDCLAPAHIQVEDRL